MSSKSGISSGAEVEADLAPVRAHRRLPGLRGCTCDPVEAHLPRARRRAAAQPRRPKIREPEAQAVEMGVESRRSSPQLRAAPQGLDREREGEPVSFERPFTFRLGRHLVRGRVDRVDRLPGGGHELMDYKTGAPKSADELRDDVQLSLYQMGARSSWGLETSGGSYYYVLDNERVPVSHTEEELERVRTTVGRVADGILAQDFEPTPAQPLCSFCDYRIICPAAET